MHSSHGWNFIYVFVLYEVSIQVNIYIYIYIYIYDKMHVSIEGVLMLSSIFFEHSSDCEARSRETTAGIKKMTKFCDTTSAENSLLD